MYVILDKLSVFTHALMVVISLLRFLVYFVNIKVVTIVTYVTLQEL